MTLGYLITGNPLAAVISHIAMHIAGVLHGPDTVVQLCRRITRGRLTADRKWSDAQTRSVVAG